MEKIIDKKVEEVWFAGIRVLVERKKSINFRLSIRFHRHNPNEEMPEVWISIPDYFRSNKINQFLEEHRSWMLKTREHMWAKVQAQPMELYAISLAVNLTNDVFYLFGKELAVVECVENFKRGKVVQVGNQLQIRASDPSTRGKKEKWVIQWATAILEEHILSFITKYEPIMGVKVLDWKIKKMKSRWGSCNIRKNRLSINFHLIHYPIEALEMIVVHEMVHLLERGHNQRFYGFMDEFLPNWRESSEMLKRPNQLTD